MLVVLSVDSGHALTATQLGSQEGLVLVAIPHWFGHDFAAHSFGHIRGEIEPFFWTLDDEVEDHLVYSHWTSPVISRWALNGDCCRFGGASRFDRNPSLVVLVLAYLPHFNQRSIG